MGRAIATSAALLILGACGTDDRASGETSGQYATGELPTADTVQRESDLHVANQQEDQHREDQHQE